MKGKNGFYVLLGFLSFDYIIWLFFYFYYFFIIGSSASAIARHTKKNKKILARDRIKLLVDPDYPVLELSPLAGLGMEYGDVPSAGIIACIAKISGQLCVINANDATVKGIYRFLSFHLVLYNK